jgi:hypothetical protein
MYRIVPGVLSDIPDRTQGTFSTQGDIDPISFSPTDLSSVGQPYIQPRAGGGGAICPEVGMNAYV